MHCRIEFLCEYPLLFGFIQFYLTCITEYVSRGLARQWFNRRFERIRFQVQLLERGSEFVHILEAVFRVAGK